jgi:3-deoxy-manno-octulosonate cytidylyltransferase (CMP-KDO synthetase)
MAPSAPLTHMRDTAIVLIPARLKASRLPNKPLADIAGAPMVVHVWRRAVAAGVGPVVVACEDAEIAAAVRAAGGEAQLTGAHHRSGSDRITEALDRLDPDRKKYGVVVNLQGDLPTIESAVIAAVLEPLADPAFAIATLARPLSDGELANPNVVKAHAALSPAHLIARATTFTRDAATCDGSCFHHIGIYAYRRAALERFVSLPPSARERALSLEQLRALDDGMAIGVRLVDTESFGVDTPADLARARAVLTK